MIVAAENPRKAAELLRKKRLYIFDMDGTIYLGGRPFDFAVRFIGRLRESGRRVLFFTNNASHDPVFYLDKLTRLGFSPTPAEICTSGNVTAAAIAPLSGMKPSSVGQLKSGCVERYSAPPRIKVQAFVSFS